MLLTADTYVGNIVKLPPAGTNTTRSVEEAFAARNVFSSAAALMADVASLSSFEIAPN